MLFDVESDVDDGSDFPPVESSVMTHLQLKWNQAAGRILHLTILQLVNSNVHYCFERIHSDL